MTFIFPTGADMVELVDTLGLGPRGEGLAGSSPAIRKQLKFLLQNHTYGYHKVM